MLLLRADAGPQIGGGHFFRCLAIASFAEDAALVVTSDLGDEFRAHADRAGVSIIDVQTDAMDELGALGAETIVLDGYQYNDTHVRALRAVFPGKIAVIDDNADRELGPVDILINPNIHAPDLEYQWNDQTLYLLGPRYALLRPVFASRRALDLPREPWRIFVCMGGSDPTGWTPRVLEALGGAGFEIDVLAGPGTDVPVESVDVQVHRNLEDPSDLMARAMLAVTAAGGMTWELACLGTPNVQIATADNQLPLAKRMDALGITRLLGRADEVEEAAVRGEVERLLADEDQLEAMSRAGRDLIDGLGAQRVAAALEGRGNELTVRLARSGDARNYWLINNHPSVRANSITTGAIDWDTHRRWFGKRLDDGQCMLLVAELDGAVAGTLRLDGIDTGEAVISIALDPRFRGVGLGTRAIDKASEKALSAVSTIVAFVRPENAASLRAFEKAGYVVRDEQEKDGVVLKRMTRTRPTLW